MFRVYFTNFGYFSQETFTNVDDAKAYVKKVFSEASVWDGDRMVASWTVFGGWRSR